MTVFLSFINEEKFFKFKKKNSQLIIQLMYLSI